MDPQQILGYIRRPESLAGAPADAIEQLIAAHPYCSIGHLLQVKFLFEQGHAQYPARLKKAAAYLPDRSLLFTLIHNRPVRGSALLSPAGMFDPTAESGREEGLEALTLRLRKLSGIELPDINRVLFKLDNIRRAHESRVGDIVAAYLQRREEEELRFNEALEAEALAREIKEHAEEIPEPSEEIGSQDTMITGEPEDHLEVVTESVSLQTDDLPGTLTEETPREILPPKDELIRRFIETSPSIQRPRKDFYSPVDIAHESTIDHEDIVSETLAIVHLEQGNVQKALKIYQRLCLIIPEKSAYFAGRIEKIKLENNLL